MLRGGLFVLLAWLYLALEGAILASIPLRFPPPDVALVMALYAAVGPFGGLEVLAVGLMGDLMGSTPLGLGALGKVLIFAGVRRFARGMELGRGGVFAVAAFLGVMLQFCLQELVLTLVSPRPPLSVPWMVGSATTTALLAWALRMLNDRLFRRWQPSSERLGP